MWRPIGGCLERRRVLSRKREDWPRKRFTSIPICQRRIWHWVCITIGAGVITIALRRNLRSLERVFQEKQLSHWLLSRGGRASSSRASLTSERPHTLIRARRSHSTSSLSHYF